MRFFIGGLVHETSSFSPIPTSMRKFHASRPAPGASMEELQKLGGASVYGQWVKRAAEQGHTIAGGPVFSAGPSGLTVQADYEALRDELLESLRSAGPVDGVLLFLHGAQMAVGYRDCEGDVLARARAIVGPTTPIGVELDLHCNISEAMLANATILMACKEYPHTDFGDRAIELFDLIAATAAGRIRPVTSFVRAPMLNLFFTTEQPMRGLVDLTVAMEGKGSVLTTTLAHGFSSADIPEAAASVIVVTDNAREEGDRIAQGLARLFFSLREIGGPKALDVDAVLDAALAEPEGRPVVIADGSDNPGGGAAGDSTFLLRRMLERGVTNAGLAMIWDPTAVKLAMTAGPGARLPMRIGGKTSPMSGDPVDAEVEVLAVHEDPKQIGFSGEKTLGFGAAAALRVGGVDVIVNSYRVQTLSLECFTELGVDPLSKRILVVKSNQHFYAHYAAIAQKVLYSDAPGTTSLNVARRPYRNLARPIWPLDDVAFG
ncbi:MAG TPA: M81 family metallopeptidase [Caulobacter sp.]|nr:M81 family metallopeptidase [Caulobacter sp.]